MSKVSEEKPNLKSFEGLLRKHFEIPEEERISCLEKEVNLNRKIIMNTLRMMSGRPLLEEEEE